MRILFLSHYFPPEVNAPAVRTFEHCRQWVRQGHEVQVVTCVPNHPQGKVYEGYRTRLRVQREEMDGIQVHRVWTYVTPNAGVVRRILGYFSYMVSASLAALRLPRPDVIVASSPQFFCACAGFATSRLLGRPWVFELRDLWPESIAAVGAMRHRGILRLLEAVELRLYADAAAVVAVTDAFRKNLISRGVPAAKVHVVTNGVNCDWPDGPDPSRARAALGLDSKFLVVYVGTHGMAHNLGTLLDAADILRQDAGVRFVTVGDGADLSRLRRLKEERGLRNVSLIGQVPHDTARLYLRASDVAVVLLRKAEVFKTVVPSKVFEAMAAQKAVILGVDGEARRIVEEAQAGLCVEPEDAGQLAEAIQRLKGDEGLRQRLGRNGLLAVRERFDRTVLAGRMLDVLTALGPSRT